MHVSRLTRILESRGVNVVVMNHFHSSGPAVVGSLRRNPVRYFLASRKYRCRTLHYHHSHWIHLLAVASAKRKGTQSRYIVTLHGMRIHHEIQSRIPIVRFLTAWALRRFDVIVVVNPATRSFLEAVIPNRRIELIPAFIPPEENVGSSTSDPDFFASHRVLLLAAYSIQVLPDHGDVYGLDTAVEAFMDIARTRPNLGLAIYLARPPADRDARRYLRRLERRLEDAGLLIRARIFVGHSLVNAFIQDVIFLRPTRSEGDALSVREALLVGIPVIASDVADRPDGVVTVPTGDARALADAIENALTATRAERATPAIDEHPEFVEKLIAIYAEAS